MIILSLNLFRQRVSPFVNIAHEFATVGQISTCSEGDPRSLVELHGIGQISGSSMPRKFALRFPPFVQKKQFAGGFSAGVGQLYGAKLLYYHLYYTLQA